MNLAFGISYAVLWLLVIVQALAIYFIARHLGQQIVFSQNAVDEQGLPAGSAVPATAMSVLPAKSDPTALQCLVFLSPSCSACHRLLLVVKAIKAEYAGSVEFFGIARAGGNERTWEQYSSAVTSVTVDERWVAGSALRIAATPFVLFVGSGATVIETGRPNNARQLRQLIDSALASHDQARLQSTESIQHAS